MNRVIYTVVIQSARAIGVANRSESRKLETVAKRGHFVIIITFFVQLKTKLK